MDDDVNIAAAGAVNRELINVGRVRGRGRKGGSSSMSIGWEGYGEVRAVSTGVRCRLQVCVIVCVHKPK